MSPIIPTEWHHRAPAMRPFVTLKTATTLDGKIATAAGESQWITGEQARAHGHQLRSQHQGIAVGIGTVLADNPRLTCRIEVFAQPSGMEVGERGVVQSSGVKIDGEVMTQPVRIVFDSQARIPLQSHLLQEDGAKRIVICGSLAPKAHVAKLEKLGVRVIQLSSPRPGVEQALHALHAEGIGTLLVEGGAGLHSSFIQANCADALILYLSGGIMADATAPGWSGHLPAQPLNLLPRANFYQSSMLGNDLWIMAHFFPAQ